MTTHADRPFAAGPPPLAVQPLSYAPPTAEGWETPIRLTLWASGIYHAVGTASTIAQAGWYYGQFTRTGSLVANPGASGYVILELFFAIAMAAAAIASFTALTRRSRGARLTIMWGAGVAAAGRVALSLVQFASFWMSTSSNTSIRANFGPAGYVGYVAMNAISPFATLVLPALIIALLTRAGARRAFGEVG
jgi:hypothetical protein